MLGSRHGQRVTNRVTVQLTHHRYDFEKGRVALHLGGLLH